MKIKFLVLMFASAVYAADNVPDCCKPFLPLSKPKAVRKAAPRKPAVQQPVQNQKQNQDQENEQEQKQSQTVNVHVHNRAQQDDYHYAHLKRSRFRLGLHAGCGPNGVKSQVVPPSTLQYSLRDGLVVGASASVRVLGPVWVTGQIFSNSLYTGGLEVEF